MTKTKVSSRGQIVIPKKIREKLGLSPGQELEVYEEEGRLVLMALPEDPAGELGGMFETEKSVRQLRESAKDEGRRRQEHLKGEVGEE